MNTVKWAILAVASLNLCACATITRGSKDVWKVDSDPSGARVETSNGFICPATPCGIEMSRKAEFTATFIMPGYKNAKLEVTHKTAGSGAAGMAGNVLIGGIIGIGVDATSGATQDLVPNPAFMKLEKEDATPAVPVAAAAPAAAAN